MSKLITMNTIKALRHRTLPMGSRGTTRQSASPFSFLFSKPRFVKQRQTLPSLVVRFPFPSALPYRSSFPFQNHPPISVQKHALISAAVLLLNQLRTSQKSHPVLLLPHSTSSVSSSCRAIVKYVPRTLSPTNDIPTMNEVFDRIVCAMQQILIRKSALMAEIRKSALMAEIRKSFSLVDKSMLLYYTGEGYRTTNEYLRKETADDDDDEVKDKVQGILLAMSKCPAPCFKSRKGQIINKVYRGTELPNDVAKTIQVGSIYLDKGFMSTSTDKKNRGFSGRGYSFTIVCHTGVDVSRYSVHKKEAEVLFRPGTQFTITKVTRKGRECAVEMEELLGS